MKKLYIDIDGVLLTKKQTRAAEWALPFIAYVTEHFECYWLTTHCKGNNEQPLRYLAKYFDDATLEKLKKIMPTNWDTLKTEGIDFASDFIWLDDAPFVSEMNVLNAHFAADKLIIVDLNRQDELKRILSLLELGM